MIENYLTKYIKDLINESYALNFNLFVIDSFITERSNDLSNNFPKSKWELMAMSPAFRDLSLFIDGPNLFTADVEFELNTLNLASETTRLISYISCLTISQLFEVFESYLKNVLTGLLVENADLFSEANRVLNVDYNFESIRSKVQYLAGTNNKGYIKFLKRISPTFKNHNNSNIYEKNMSLWFDLIADVRNITVHHRQKIPLSFFDKINSGDRKSFFEEHFFILQSQNDHLLGLNYYNASTIINYLVEYGYLMYKSLSADYQLDNTLLV